jgi:nuclear transcription Y subunit beta
LIDAVRRFYFLFLPQSSICSLLFVYFTQVERMENGDSNDNEGGLSDSYLVQSYGMEGAQEGDGSAHEDGEQGCEEPPLREQDRFLPIANVARIMKRSIPKTGKIAKEAKDCVQECVSEFVSFITSEASERCHQEKRKTINGEDILYAMSTLGFDSYVEPLKVYLQKYRESTKGEKTGPTPGGGPDAGGEDLNAEETFATLGAGMLPTDNTPIIYTYTTTQQNLFGL